MIISNIQSFKLKLICQTLTCSITLGGQGSEFLTENIIEYVIFIFDMHAISQL